jgi:ribosomal protein S18 acetylase RimI-like enzyme
MIEVAAVDPDAQGKGAGTRLLEAYFKTKDSAHSLMSSNPRNVAFYQRNGYKTLRSYPCFGTHFTTMYRPKVTK